MAQSAGKISRQGQDWVEEITGNLAASPRLHVETPGGNVEVRGGSGADIAYRVLKHVRARDENDARRKFALAALEAKRSGDVATLSLEPQRRRSEVGASFFITVPKAQGQVHAETAGGNVWIENIDGEAIADTAGGDIRADQIGGAAKLGTAGGQMYLGTIRGKLIAETAGGNITLREVGGESKLETSGGTIMVESCGKSLRAESAGGDVTVRRCNGDVHAETAGGAIHLGTINGVVIAETAGGAIEVESARAIVRAGTASGPIKLGRISGPVRAETAGGNIACTLMADRASWAESLLDTAGGDVIVYIPSDLALTIRATIRMTSSAQGIRSDFPLTMRNANGIPGMHELTGEAQLNGGGAQLKIRTMSGRIDIRKVSR